MLPVRDVDHRLWLAPERAESMERTRRQLPTDFADLPMILAEEERLQRLLSVHESAALTHQAETRVNASESCRIWTAKHSISKMLAGGVLAGSVFYAAPALTFAFLALIAIITLLANTTLKVVAGFLALRRVPARRDPVPPRALPMKLPVISILVPLFEESEIANRQE